MANVKPDPPLNPPNGCGSDLVRWSLLPGLPVSGVPCSLTRVIGALLMSWWCHLPARNRLLIGLDCRPRLLQGLSSPCKPIIQPRAFRTGGRSPLKPDAFGRPGKHGRHVSVCLRLKLSPRGSLLSWDISFWWLKPALRCCKRQLILFASAKWEIKLTLRRALKPIRQLNRKIRSVRGTRCPWGIPQRNYSRFHLLSPDAHRCSLIPGSKRTGAGSSRGDFRKEYERNTLLAISSQVGHEPSTSAVSAWAWPNTEHSTHAGH